MSQTADGTQSPRRDMSAAGNDGMAQSDRSLEGHIDAKTPGYISGWAYDRSRPGTPVTLEVLVDGELAGEFSADAFRDDLAEAGHGFANCAFTYRFAAPLPPDADHVLTVRRAGDHVELFGSPAVLAARPPDAVGLEGCIDACSIDEIDGWAFDASAPKRPVRLEILDDGRVVGQIMASGYRADLAEAGKGGGWCCFSFRFARRLAPWRDHVIQVRRAGDQTLVAEKWLPAQPLDGQATPPARIVASPATAPYAAVLQRG